MASWRAHVFVQVASAAVPASLPASWWWHGSRRLDVHVLLHMCVQGVPCRAHVVQRCTHVVQRRTAAGVGSAVAHDLTQVFMHSAGTRCSRLAGTT